MAIIPFRSLSQHMTADFCPEQTPSSPASTSRSERDTTGMKDAVVVLASARREKPRKFENFMMLTF